MALTLASGISASDRYCTVNQPPTQPPGSYYRIGDEVVQHIGFATPTPVWSQTFLELYIARGQLGTTAASHLSAAALTYVRSEFLSAPAETDPGPFETGGVGGGGVTVTDGVTSVTATEIQMPSGTVVDLGSGVAGVGLVLSLQSLVIPFDEPSLNGSTADHAVVVAMAPAGSIVHHCWAVVTQDFDDTGLGQFHIYVEQATDPGNNVGVWARNLSTTAIEGVNFLLADPSSSPTQITPVIALNAVKVSAQFTQMNGDGTQGSVTAYAIIATPAV